MKLSTDSRMLSYKTSMRERAVKALATAGLYGTPLRHTTRSKFLEQDHVNTLIKLFGDGGSFVRGHKTFPRRLKPGEGGGFYWEDMQIAREAIDTKPAGLQVYILPGSDGTMNQDLSASLDSSMLGSQSQASDRSGGGGDRSGERVGDSDCDTSETRRPI